jgi:hypothetical protein
MKQPLFPWRHIIGLLLFLALPAVVRGQFTFTTNGNSITITGYTGPGGVVSIPGGTNNGYAIKDIGDGAFAYYTNLTSIAIPSSITNIGTEAFMECTSLTNVSIINGVANIGEEAFFNCDSLMSIALTNALSVGDLAFFGCTALTSVILTNNNSYYYLNELTHGISLGMEAFAFCTGVTNVIINGAVANIGELAFFECSGITSVTIATNSFGSSIGPEAFAFCTGLTNVFIASTVTNISVEAFEDCTNLTSIYFQGNAPPDVGNTFYGDSNAIVYYFPGTTGWNTTFGGAPTVEEATPASEFSFEMDVPGSVAVVRYNGRSSVVVVPSYINGYPVTSIGGDGGVFPLGVTSVAIPNIVTNIAYSAFGGCSSLTSVTIPGSVISIGQMAFIECTSLTNIVIPDGVTSIGIEAFANCSSLTNVIISDSVTNIGSGAFGFCTSLPCITFPSGVIGIGQEVLYACFSLTNISVDVFNSFYSSLNGVLFDKTQDTLIDYPSGLASDTYIIPSSVTNIMESAFGRCTSLTSVYFQGNVPSGTGVGNAFNDDPTIVYYLPGTTGWGATFGGAPTELWNPQAATFTTSDGQFGFNITGPTNATIVVETCTNLANPVWLPVSTNTLSGSGTSSFNDPQTANYPDRYYRFTAP